MPEKKSQFTTLKWMVEVYQLRCYCPKMTDITFKHCERPPSNEQLIAIYEDYVERRSNWNGDNVNQFLRLLTHMRRNSPDKRFLLGLISHVAPGSHIFERGFKPANTRNAKPEVRQNIPD